MTKQCPSCGGDCGGTKKTGCLYRGAPTSNGLIYDLRTEADLCRNESADDIAVLLDRAAEEITKLREVEFAAKMIAADYQANKFSHDSMITMLEALRGRNKE